MSIQTTMCSVFSPLKNYWNNITQTWQANPSSPVLSNTCHLDQLYPWWEFYTIWFTNFIVSKKFHYVGRSISQIMSNWYNTYTNISVDTLGFFFFLMTTLIFFLKKDLEISDNAKNILIIIEWKILNKCSIIISGMGRIKCCKDWSCDARCHQPCWLCPWYCQRRSVYSSRKVRYIFYYSETSQ